MIEKSYLYVDQFINQTWVPILTDGDLETKFIWTREGLDHNNITVEWDIPLTQPTGQTLYRLRHLGVKVNISGKAQYEGQSKNFTITN